MRFGLHPGTKVGLCTQTLEHYYGMLLAVLITESITCGWRSTSSLISRPRCSLIEHRNSSLQRQLPLLLARPSNCITFLYKTP
ncbi:hypothetical protein KC19_12G189800 [Ceratodon purpureus]|uniref:Uncharacterized protein n=1 Tax=Ceratodon purpureus TaxID=3225 RepID=A0A8T0G9E9_CERPU|nr:hypothetical protein KC19_12G189800 [Ceratodon purpureus]